MDYGIQTLKNPTMNLPSLIPHNYYHTYMTSLQHYILNLSTENVTKFNMIYDKTQYQEFIVSQVFLINET